jgi:hypothetical protein
MAYWTVTGDTRNDAAKGRDWRDHLAKTDWDAEMLRLEKEAVLINDTEIGKRADRKVAALRRDWVAARNNKYFVEHGRQHPSVC